MPKFTVILTDEQAARLDRFRAQMGLRSSADVVRRWIDREDMVRVDAAYESEMRFTGGITRTCPNGGRCFTPEACQTRGRCGGKAVPGSTVEALVKIDEAAAELISATAPPPIVEEAMKEINANAAKIDALQAKPPRQGVAKAWIRTPKRRAR